jgi:hypothetical protein
VPERHFGLVYSPKSSNSCLPFWNEYTIGDHLYRRGDFFLCELLQGLTKQGRCMQECLRSPGRKRQFRFSRSIMSASIGLIWGRLNIVHLEKSQEPALR